MDARKDGENISVVEDIGNYKEVFKTFLHI